MTTQGALRKPLSGRYRLGRRIGRGASAEVWVATDERLGREVAVKLFLAEVDDAGWHQRVEAEMRLLAALRHPGLVTVHDAGFDDERPYLVMELVNGPTLRQRLASGPLHRDEATAVGAALADALGYVHAAGIVHRDVKPANVLLEQRDGQPWPVVKLADFGIARLDSAPRLTIAATTIGTANYLSPEQVRGADVGPASDVYSLGLVLLECRTGRVAYEGTGVEAASARLHQDPELPESIEEPERDLLAAMTARDPSARPTATAVAAVLRSIPVTAEPDAGTTVLPTAQQAGPGRADTGTAILPAVAARRRPRPAVLVAVLAIALIVIALVVVISESGGPTPSGPPHYPAVPGQLGQHLSQLEGAIG